MFNEYGYPVYVSVAEKRARAEKALKKEQKKGKNLHPVRIIGRTIASSFWGKEWCKHIERFADYDNRLGRARSYLRSGCVLDLKYESNHVLALVQGSSLYKVDIEITPLPQERWEKICETSEGRVEGIMDVLHGKIPTKLISSLCNDDTGLFPRMKEMSFSCSCPDWASMCKHVGAVLYGIGNRLDSDPKMLFDLRGVDPIGLTAASYALNIAKTTEDILEGENLGELFGIDFEENPVEALPLGAEGQSGAAKGATEEKSVAVEANPAPAKAETEAEPVVAEVKTETKPVITEAKTMPVKGVVKTKSVAVGPRSRFAKPVTQAKGVAAKKAAEAKAVVAEAKSAPTKAVAEAKAVATEVKSAPAKETAKVKAIVAEVKSAPTKAVAEEKAVATEVKTAPTKAVAEAKAVAVEVKSAPAKEATKAKAVVAEVKSASAKKAAEAKAVVAEAKSAPAKEATKVKAVVAEAKRASAKGASEAKAIVAEAKSAPAKGAAEAKAVVAEVKSAPAKEATEVKAVVAEAKSAPAKEAAEAKAVATEVKSAPAKGKAKTEKKLPEPLSEEEKAKAKEICAYSFTKGEEIRALRKLARMTEEQFCKNVKISLATLQRWEREKTISLQYTSLSKLHRFISRLKKWLSI